MKYSYDELYGISLEEYCTLHKKTPEEIILSIETDIAILRKNYDYYASIKDSLDFDGIKLPITINKLIKSKKEHMTRIKEYFRMD